MPVSRPLPSSSDWKNSVALGAIPWIFPFEAVPSPSTEPATWVPWPSGSEVSLVRPWATLPTMRPWKSGWVSSMPVSATPMICPEPSCLTTSRGIVPRGASTASKRRANSFHKMGVSYCRGAPSTSGSPARSSSTGASAKVEIRILRVPLPMMATDLARSQASILGTSADSCSRMSNISGSSIPKDSPPGLMDWRTACACGAGGLFHSTFSMNGKAWTPATWPDPSFVL